MSGGSCRSRILLMASLIMLLTLLTLLTGPVHAIELYSGKHYPPSYSLGIGYNIFSLSGSNQVLEYYEPDDSIVLEGHLEAYPLPHRFNFEAAMHSDDDLYLDAGYAYRDIVLSRLVMTEFVHNEQKVFLPDLDPSTTRGYIENDPSGKYHEDTGTAQLSVRLKVPGYPFHLFGRYFNYHKESWKQQRFLTGYFTTDMRVHSTGRPVDYETEEYRFGANGHVGPVEVEYLHREKEFQPERRTVMHDYYPGISAREAGFYPHNLLPGIKSSSDYLKLHTSYTGRLVSSITFMSTRARNDFSTVSRNIRGISGSIRYLPFHELGFFIRYRYMKTDEDAPRSLFLAGASGFQSFSVRQPFDYRRSDLNVDVRYRPSSKITMIGGVDLREKRYSGLDEWLLLDDPGREIVYRFKVYGRPFRNTKIVAEIRFHDFQHPRLNTEPDISRELMLRGTFTPFPWFNGTLVYRGKWDERDNLRYYDTGTEMVLEGGERERGTHNLLMVASFIPSEKTSVTFGYGYYRNRIRQMLLYGRFQGDGTAAGGIPFNEDSVPYTDESNLYLVSISHRLHEKISLNASLSHVSSSGRFSTTAEDTDEIDTFSILKVEESEVRLGCRIRGLSGIEFRPSVTYRRYDDKEEERNSGESFRLFMIVSGRW